MSGRSWGDELRSGPSKRHSRRQQGETVYKMKEECMQQPSAAYLKGVLMLGRKETEASCDGHALYECAGSHVGKVVSVSLASAARLCLENTSSSFAFVVILSDAPSMSSTVAVHLYR